MWKPCKGREVTSNLRLLTSPLTSHFDGASLLHVTTPTTNDSLTLQSQAVRVRSERDDQLHPDQVACSSACCSTQLTHLTNNRDHAFRQITPLPSLPINACMHSTRCRETCRVSMEGWQVANDEVDVTRRERNMGVCMVWRRPTTFRCRVPGPSELSLFPLFQKPGLRFRVNIV